MWQRATRLLLAHSHPVPCKAGLHTGCDSVAVIVTHGYHIFQKWGNGCLVCMNPRTNTTTQKYVSHVTVLAWYEEKKAVLLKKSNDESHQSAVRRGTVRVYFAIYFTSKLLYWPAFQNFFERSKVFQLIYNSFCMLNLKLSFIFVGQVWFLGYAKFLLQHIFPK